MAEDTSDVSSSYGTLDVGDLLSRFSDVGTQLGASLGDLFTAQRQGQEGQQLSEQAANAQAAATIKLNTVEGQAAAQRQRDIAGTAAAFGANPQAQNYILPVLAEEVAAGEQDISNRAEMIQHKLDQSFFDDPVQWLGNQITLPFDQRALEFKKATVAEKTNRIATIEQQTTAAATMITAVEQADATQKMQALNEQALATAQKDVAQSKYDAARLGIAGAQTRAAISNEQYDAALKLNQSLIAEQDLRIRQVMLNPELELKKAQKQYYEDTAALRAEEAANATERMAAKKRLQQRLDNATSSFGMQQMSIEEFFKYGQNSPIRQVLEEGMIDPYVQNGAYGPTPAKILDRLTSMNFPLAPGVKDTLNHENDVRNEVVGSHPEWANLKPEEKDRLVNQALRDKYTAELNNVPSNPEKSIYAPPPLLVAISNSPFIANMELSKALGPLANANGHYELNASQVFETANTLVKAGTLTPAQASQQVAALYRGVLDNNSKVRQYTKLGLPDPNNPNDYKGFKTFVQTGMGIVSKQMDMTNAGQIEAWLTRRRLFDIAEQQGQVTQR